MKAILLLDEMPNACEDCSLNIDDLCAGTREPIHSIGCPLKPMPEKVTENVMKGMPNEEWQMLYDEGWNDCVKEIEK